MALWRQRFFAGGYRERAAFSDSKSFQVRVIALVQRVLQLDKPKEVGWLIHEGRLEKKSPETAPESTICPRPYTPQNLTTPRPGESSPPGRGRTGEKDNPGEETGSGGGIR